jgi:CBS domain-containing protein
MSTPVFSVHPDTSLETLEEQLANRHFGGAVVLAASQVVGIVTKTDIVRYLTLHRMLSGVVVDYLRKTATLPNRNLGARASSTREEEQAARRALGGQLRGARVRDCMVTGVHSVASNAELEDVAAVMTSKGVHRVPVIDNGKLMGMLTSMDLIRHMASGSRHYPRSEAKHWGHAWHDLVRHLRAPRYSGRTSHDSRLAAGGHPR